MVTNPRIYKMVSNSKSKDKINKRKTNDPINTNYIKKLIIKQNMNCYLCKKKMSVTCKNYSNNLCTIDRLNNKIGHSKSNTKLACFKCNNSKSKK